MLSRLEDVALEDTDCGTAWESLGIALGRMEVSTLKVVFGRECVLSPVAC